MDSWEKKRMQRIDSKKFDDEEFKEPRGRRSGLTDEIDEYAIPLSEQYSRERCFRERFVVKQSQTLSLLNCRAAICKIVAMQRPRSHIVDNCLFDDRMCTSEIAICVSNWVKSA